MIDSSNPKEIRIDELMSMLLKQWRFILKGSGVAFIVGVVIVFTTPGEWDTSARMILESESSSFNSSSIGGLASIAGVKIPGEQEGSISPELYTEIIGSIPFMLELMNRGFQFDFCDCSMSMEQYMKGHLETALVRKIGGLPKKAINFLKPKPAGTGVKGEFVQLTYEQLEIIEELRSRIVAYVDKNTDLLIVNTRMQNPLLAAEVNQFTIDYLTKSVVNYVTNKEKERLEFIQSQVEENEANFLEAQKALARFKDRNQGVLSNQANTILRNLQSNYDLEFNLLSSLREQLSQAKIKVQEKTPVFTELDPVIIPTIRSKPKRVTTIIIFCIVGAILAGGWLVIKSIFNYN
ncbi:hypothetical protein [Roseivirga sp.]|uniref:hypothetical protein n=1 Tax=Roseivirga sp. TaxID=1964215 RepID=UPI003B8D05D6